MGSISLGTSTTTSCFRWSNTRILMVVKRWFIEYGSKCKALGMFFLPLWDLTPNLGTPLASWKLTLRCGFSPAFVDHFLYIISLVGFSTSEFPPGCRDPSPRPSSWWGRFATTPAWRSQAAAPAAPASLIRPPEAQSLRFWLRCFMGRWGIPNRIMTICINMLVIDGYWYYSPLWQHRF